MFYYLNKDNQAANLNNDPREIFKHENREELIKENHKRYCDFNTIAIDTTNCIWFDIDIENLQTIPVNIRTGQVCPYSNKKVHFEFSTSDQKAKEIAEYIQKVSKRFAMLASCSSKLRS